jgi:hypothetical protein
MPPITPILQPTLEPQPSTPSPEPDAPPQIQSENPDFLEAAADLDAQLKGRSRFDKLSPRQQAAIIHLMQVHEIEVVLELLAAPGPTGMSFKIGRSALYEFKRRYDKREARRQREQKAKTFEDLLKKSGHPEQTFLVNFEHLLQVKALTAASLPDTSLETLDAVTTTINKLRKQTLAERKQTHAEKTK